MYTPGHTRLIGTGSYLPEERMTSRDVMEQFGSTTRYGVPPDWLERTTGIRERRIAPLDMPPSEMAVTAAREALERSHLRPADIDLIIYTGVTRDCIEPATAHIVQAKIGADRAVAFDMANACLGFMSAMHVMDAMIATGQARYGLVVTGERGYDFTRRAISRLKSQEGNDNLDELFAGLTLGDAGAAVVMGPKIDPDTGILGFIAQSSGQHHSLCTCGNDDDDALITHVVPLINEMCRIGEPMFQELMDDHLHWTSPEIDHYLPHQVGMRSVKRHAGLAGVDMRTVPITVDSLGNIVTANIPVALNLLERRGQACFGDKIILSGNGSGICLNQAGMVWDVH